MRFEVDDINNAGPERVTRRAVNVIASLHENIDAARTTVRPAAGVLSSFTALALARAFRRLRQIPLPA